MKPLNFTPLVEQQLLKDFILECENFYLLYGVLPDLDFDSRKAGSVKTNQTQSKTFLCKICQKEFQTITGRRKHDLTKHQKIRFNCKFCFKTFTQKAHLKTHALKKHRGKE
jgi:uncharacterized Zn-finger protein